MNPSMRAGGVLAVACVTVCLASPCWQPCIAQEQSAADRRLPWVTDVVDAPGVSFRTFDSRAAGV